MGELAVCEKRNADLLLSAMTKYGTAEGCDKCWPNLGIVEGNHEVLEAEQIWDDAWFFENDFSSVLQTYLKLFRALTSVAILNYNYRVCQQTSFEVAQSRTKNDSFATCLSTNGSVSSLKTK